jgi:hypothetical protein
MSTTKNKKYKGKHFTRSEPMSYMLLEILADEALKGNKSSSTFKVDNLLLRWLQKLVKNSTCNASLSIWTIISKLYIKNGE